MFTLMGAAVFIFAAMAAINSKSSMVVSIFIINFKYVLKLLFLGCISINVDGKNFYSRSF